MSKELDRLLNMKNEHKISESDYQMLSNALTKKSFCTNLENSIFINPFKKIAGLQALLIGIILMLAMSILGAYAHIYVDGSLGYFVPNNAIKVARAPNFLLLFYQNAVACFCVASLFFLSAVVLHQKRIRIIDFLGTVTLSRYPTCISIIYVIIDKYLHPVIYNQDITKGISLNFSVTGTISGLVFMVCLVWQIMTYFSALKEASGLEGKRLWSAFIITLLLADVIAIILTRLFLYI